MAADAGALSMAKRPLLLFSGGLDSTVMLQQALCESPVDVLYGEAGSAPQKAINERAARIKIIAHFNQVMPYKVWNEFEPNQVVSLNGSPQKSWGQMMPWLVYALQAADPDQHSEVQVGFVMGDSNCVVFDEMVKAWNALWAISKNGPVVPLVMPLKLHVKPTLLNRLDPRVYSMLWICETPDDDKKCGRCLPCMTHQNTLNLFKNALGRSYSRVVKERLTRLKNNPDWGTDTKTDPERSQFRCTNKVRKHTNFYKWEDF